MFTQIYMKNDRIRIERWENAGPTLVTRLSFSGIAEAVRKWPRLWHGDKVALTVPHCTGYV